MNLKVKQKIDNRQSGFTLMEIMVATVIFAVVAVALLSLFNYVLKINRRSDALRQASQDMRDMVEYVVKEVRNGQVDYGFVDPGGTQQSSPPAPCNTLHTSGYKMPDNRLALLNTDNVEECFYYGIGTAYAGSNVVSSSTGATNLVLAKGSLAAQSLNPSNFTVNRLMFLVHPQNDPYTSGNPKSQPVVTIIMQFSVNLPTGESTVIYYQTSVSSNKYDIPNAP